MLKVGIDNNLNFDSLLAVAKEQGKKGAKDISEQIYNQTQNRCQVKSGKLKSSGYITELSDGYEVGYSASYADYIDKLPAQWVKNGTPSFFSEVVENYSRGGRNV